MKAAFVCVGRGRTCCFPLTSPPHTGCGHLNIYRILLQFCGIFVKMFEGVCAGGKNINKSQLCWKKLWAIGYLFGYQDPGNAIV